VSVETESESINSLERAIRKTAHTVYEFGFGITFFVAYFALWFWFIAEAGLFLGLLLGWLFALVPAIFIAAVWPGIAALALLLFLLVYLLK
jgi:hypothetical protein